MTPGGLDHVRRNPHTCIRWLNESCAVDAMEITVVKHNNRSTIFDVRFEPPPPWRLPGYPAERVRVVVRANGDIFTVPAATDERAWLHRYPRLSIRQVLAWSRATPIPLENLFGSLCLEYPWDPDHLRWNWSDGIDAYLRIVQRHLWCEEYWRRHGSWPVEDAPHGHRSDGRTHPIKTAGLRVA